MPVGSTRIVEQKDAEEAELALREVGTSVYAFDAAALRDALGRLSTDNAQGEEYLTDVVGLHRAAGLGLHAVVARDAAETAGVNDRAQLAAAARTCATACSPSTCGPVWRCSTRRRPGSTPTSCSSRTARCTRGCSCTAARSCAAAPSWAPTPRSPPARSARGPRVVRTHAEGAVVGPRASVGPYSFLRPGTRLEEGAKVGAYVEVKASTLGPGAKVPHLAYVGDATIGARSNLGAGTITANYDGLAKHRTVVGEDVRVGSNTVLVAPVTVHDGAYTAAGSAVVDDVPAGSLAVGRARQRIIEGWVARRRALPDRAEEQSG